MNDLQIDIKAFRAIRMGIGILSILAGVAYFFSQVSDLGIIAPIISVLWILMGLGHVTNDFGANKNLVKTNDSQLEIRWAGLRRTRIVKADEIENIAFNRYYITINRKNDKPLMLGLRYFELEQKKMAYNYFTEIAEKYKITVVRN